MKITFSIPIILQIRSRLLILAAFIICFTRVLSQRRNLGYVINDIVSLIPKQRIQDITTAELQTNPGLQRVFEYLNSKEWKDTEDTVSQHPRYQYIINYMEKEGVPWRRYEKWFENVLATKYTPIEGISSIQSYTRAVEKSIPVSKIAAKAILYKFSNPSFRKFEKVIGDDQTRKLANYFRGLPGTVKLDMLLRKVGFNWNTVIWDPIYKYFRWSR